MNLLTVNKINTKNKSNTQIKHFKSILLKSRQKNKNSQKQFGKKKHYSINFTSMFCLTVKLVIKNFLKKTVVCCTKVLNR